MRGLLARRLWCMTLNLVRHPLMAGMLNKRFISLPESAQCEIANLIIKPMDDPSVARMMQIISSHEPAKWPPSTSSGGGAP